MNSIGIKTLKVLYSICGDEGFKIIDASDILVKIEGLQSDKLSEVIDALNTANLVEVKYSDKTEYCLSITKTGKATVEEELQKLAQRERALEAQKEKLRLELIEKEAEKNKKSSILKSFKKKEQEAIVKLESLDKDTIEEDIALLPEDINFDLDTDTPSTIVVREIMLNRETVRLIARVAFFSAFLGAALGSIIVSLIFFFI